MAHKHSQKPGAPKLKRMIRPLSFKRLRSNPFSKVQLIAFILVFGGLGGYLLLQSHAAGPVANLWIDGGSGSCSRSSTPVAYSATTACNNGPQAYAAANLGDTVLIQGNLTVTSQWNFSKNITKSVPDGTCNYNYGGTPDLSNCITIKPATGQSLSFDVAGSNLSQVLVCVSGLSIQNATINETTSVDQFGDTVSNASIGVGSGDNTCGTTPPHDIYLASINYGGQAAAVGGSYNVWFVGGTATSTADLPWQGAGDGNNGLIPAANHNGIVGMRFDGYNFTNTDPTHHHMECLHATGALDHFTLANSVIIGCPVESFFFETNGPTAQTNILVENNFFDTGAALTFSCHNNGCTVSNVTVRFNTFSATDMIILNDCNNNGTCTGATMDNDVVYGNIGDGCSTVVSGMGGTAGSGWRSAYNVETGPQQGICIGDSTSAYNATVNLTSPGSPNYDLHLANGSQTAVDFVPTSVSGGCPATDIDGNSRPQGSACDAGADEYVSGSPTPAPTVNLSATPSSITSGSSSTLNWSSTNATACNASGGWSGAKATSGSQSVSPTSTATYSLTCTGTGGTSSPASTTVTVNSPPPPSSVPGDVNGDGHVDVSDLSILLRNFGQPGTLSQGDLSGDGHVDVTDLSILLRYFGT